MLLEPDIVIGECSNVIFCWLRFRQLTLCVTIVIMEELEEQRQRAVRWLYSDAGRVYLRTEQALINRLLRPIFGVRLLQLGVLDSESLFAESQINHCFALAPQHRPGGINAAVSEFENLPLDQHSIDCLLIHHVLEFSANPHAILREAARVIRPEGQIIVVAFNPWSMLGLQQKLAWRLRRRAWRMDSPSSHKLSDWLRLLDFSVASVDYCWHLPAFHNAAVAEKLLRYEGPLHRLTRPFGATTLVSAKKRSRSLTPVRRRWADLSPGLAVPIMKPSTRAAMQAKDDA